MKTDWKYLGIPAIIDWQKIPCIYKYIAIDLDGCICAYIEKPVIRVDVWGRNTPKTAGYIDTIYTSYIIGFLATPMGNWQETLIKRPCNP